MGSVYASSGRSGGSVYAGSGTSSGSVYAGRGGGSAKKPPHHGGFLHSVEKYSGAQLAGNLAKDIGNTAVGVAPGLYEAGKALVNPTLQGALHGEGSRQEKRASKDSVGFVKGIGKGYADYYGHHLGQHLYNHPLQPILDALTVADLGSTAAVKLGALDAGRAELLTRSPRAIATDKGPVHADISSTKPIVRGRQVLANKARARRPEGVAGIGGEVKRYGRQIQQQANQHALAHLNDYEPYVKAVRRLSEKEQTALNIRPMDIHPDDLAALWKGSPAGKALADPEVRRLVLMPSPRMVEAEQAARRLSKAGEKLLRDRGKLKEETANARPDLTRRQATEVLGRPVRQLHGDPYYLPHTLEGDAKAANPLRATGGGKGIPRRLGSTKQNTGALALSGKLHLRSDVLGPEFLRRVKFVKYDEIHNALRRGAIRVTKQELDQHYGGQLPKGYEYLRVKPGQRIPPTMRGESQVGNPIDKLVPNAGDLHDSELAKQGFSTTDPAQAHTAGGRYYILPKSTVKAATGEFTRSSDFTHAFITKPLQVWRSAVLGLRVGFLTNNLVGNSVMYAAKTGGQGALRDLLGAIRDEHGAAVAKKALDSAATPPAVRQSLYKEFFPEQMHGTFGKTQSPSTSAVHQAGSKVSEGYRTATGAIPKLTNAVAETGFRKALIRHYIRHSPEFKTVYRSLPKDTRTFEEAARRVLTGKGGPAYQRYVSQQVNRALGDYLNLSPTERNVLRNTLPFYAWYKAITTTTAHLAIDTPLRANILGQIGQIGKQWSDQKLGDVPSFLEGSIPLGDGPGGTKRVLSTQGLNPYATLEQIRKGGTEDITSLGLNPFLMGAMDAYANAKGKHTSLSPLGIGESTLKDIGVNLPPVRLGFPQAPSKLYPNRNRKSTLFSYLGIPVKEYNPSVAAQQKRQGR